MEYKCFRCNHELMIDNNFMATDVGLVPEEEWENYPYFQNEGANQH